MIETKRDLVQLFGRRRDFSKALLELSRLQHRTVPNEQIDELMGLLDHKQQILDEWTHFTERHTAAWEMWMNHRSSIPTDIVTRCQELLEEAESTFAELLQLERESVEWLSARSEETRQELSSTVTEQAVRNGYHQQEPSRILNVEL